jgi:hypothetical protein
MSRALRSQCTHHTSARRPPCRVHAAIVKRTVTVTPSRIGSAALSRRANVDESCAARRRRV